MTSTEVWRTAVERPENRPRNTPTTSKMRRQSQVKPSGRLKTSGISLVRPCQKSLIFAWTISFTVYRNLYYVHNGIETAVLNSIWFTRSLPSAVVRREKMKTLTIVARKYMLLGDTSARRVLIVMNFAA